MSTQQPSIVVSVTFKVLACALILMFAGCPDYSALREPPDYSKMTDTGDEVNSQSQLLAGNTDSANGIPGGNQALRPRPSKSTGWLPWWAYALLIGLPLVAVIILKLRETPAKTSDDDDADHIADEATSDDPPGDRSESASSEDSDGAAGNSMLDLASSSSIGLGEESELEFEDSLLSFSDSNLALEDSQLDLGSSSLDLKEELFAAEEEPPASMTSTQLPSGEGESTSESEPDPEMKPEMTSLGIQGSPSEDDQAADFLLTGAAPAKSQIAADSEDSQQPSDESLGADDAGNAAEVEPQPSLESTAKQSPEATLPEASVAGGTAQSNATAPQASGSQNKERTKEKALESTIDKTAESASTVFQEVLDQMQTKIDALEAKVASLRKNRNIAYTENKTLRGKLVQKVELIEKLQARRDAVDLSDLDELNADQLREKLQESCQANEAMEEQLDHLQSLNAKLRDKLRDKLAIIEKLSKK